MGGFQFKSAEQYNTATGQWSAFPSMGEARCGCAAAMLNGKIIVVGGVGWGVDIFQAERNMIPP
eukprot:11066393-Ditylum_brightwellii.AAC.1